MSFTPVGVGRIAFPRWWVDMDEWRGGDQLPSSSLSCPGPALRSHGSKQQPVEANKLFWEKKLHLQHKTVNAVRRMIC